MKRSRAEARPPRDGFLWSFTAAATVGFLALGMHLKSNIDEAAAQPDCIVAVGSGDSIASIEDEIRDAGDRHHRLGQVLDMNGDPITVEERPRLEANGDIKVYLGDMLVVYFVGEPACDTVQGRHNAPPVGSDVPVGRFVEPFWWLNQTTTS